MAELSNPVANEAEQAASVFSISREFNATPELVFKAWTEAERMGQWWGPKGFPLQVKKLDAQPQGVFHYAIELPGGQKMWGKFVYQEVTAPERLVFINSFSDEAEGQTRHPFNPAWPMEIWNEVSFKAQNGKTLLTIQGQPHQASAEELKAFADSRDSMRDGFTGTFDQLEAYLAQAKA